MMDTTAIECFDLKDFEMKMLILQHYVEESWNIWRKVDLTAQMFRF